MGYDVNSDWDGVYESIINECADLFEKKLQDYGATWLYFRDISLIDTLWIKIKRIRTLEENKDITLVGEGREGEFIGIINYSVIMLMKMKYPDIMQNSDYYIDNPSAAVNIGIPEILKCYRSVASEICDLCKRKNHDYGAAWTGMHPHSITDQIIIRVLRIKNFFESEHSPSVSEGTDAQLMDIVNYSIFGLIMARGLDD